MLKQPTLKLAALAAMTLSAYLPSTVFAGVEASGKEPKNLVEETTKSCITGDLGVNFVTKYFSRGIDLENQGVIGQPYADLYFKIYDGGDAFVSSATINLGIWSSIHSHHPGNTSSTPAWYEFDWTPGVSVVFAKKLTATLSYFEFDSPNDSFGIARSINLNLAYDDSDWLGAFALHPHFAVLKELPGGGVPEGVAGLGPDGWYFEPGIAPSVPLVKDGTFPITLTLPLTAGFGGGDFYLGDGFGYFSAGANVAVGLGFMPKSLGTWTANLGATYYYLHHNVAKANNGDNNDWVGQAGVAVAF